MTKTEKFCLPTKKFSLWNKSFNKQNDRVYARSSTELSELVPKVQWDHHPSAVMGCYGDAALMQHFCEKGLKTSAKIYPDTILENFVKPLNNALFKNKH